MSFFSFLFFYHYQIDVYLLLSFSFFFLSPIRLLYKAYVYSSWPIANLHFFWPTCEAYILYFEKNSSSSFNDHIWSRSVFFKKTLHLLQWPYVSFSPFETWFLALSLSLFLFLFLSLHTFMFLLLLFCFSHSLWTKTHLELCSFNSQICLYKARYV